MSLRPRGGPKDGPRREAPGVSRTSEYLFLAEAIGLPAWLVMGHRYMGYDPGLGDQTVMLLEPDGEGRVPVPKAWVRLDVEYASE